MKKQFTLTLLVGFLAFFMSLPIFMETQAIDAFTFFIPYPADLLDDQFDVAVNDEAPNPACADLIDDDINTTISIVTKNGAQIYYDHWEDGMEINLASPTQASTEVWGDNDPANGIPPGFSLDVLQAESIIILQNRVILPRDPANFFYDGGDTFTSIGSNLAVTLAVWPTCSGTLFAGAWELYPTSRWGVHYIIPIGEDRAPSDPAPGPKRRGFGTVGLNVQAAQDNTEVQLDLNADGVFETIITLNQGQHFTQVSGIRSGAEIQASDRVQVHLFSGDPTRIPAIFEGRAYTIVPRGQWTGDYLAPRSADGNYWLYNPDSVPLTVTIETSRTTTSLVIPAKRVARYPNPPPLPPLSPPTGLRLRSTDGRPFYGLVALDPGAARDWGYSLLPIDNLTRQVLVGWGPGNTQNPPSADDSRIYVTAATTTTLQVDYENDGTIDVTLPITPLRQAAVVDPDHDLTGAFLATSDGTPFVAVWGEDPSAPEGLPGIDVGTSLIPLPALPIQKTVALVDDADGTGTMTWGDTIRFEMLTVNNTIGAISGVVILDAIPTTVSYIPSSSTLRGLAIPDDGVGATIFPFDEGGYQIGTLTLSEVVTATFEAIINLGAESIVNTATVDSPLTPPRQGQVDIPLAIGRYDLDKRLLNPANGLASAGQIITFGLTITNTGNISITKLPLRDTFDESHLTFLTAAPPPHLTASGVITWSDLATPTLGGPLPPNGTIGITLTFAVDQIPATITTTLNVARVEGALGSDGSRLPPAEADAPVNFLPPPTPTPQPDDDDDDLPPPTATPIPPPASPPKIEIPPTPTEAPAILPTPTPPAMPSPTVTPTVLPVKILPETGQRPSPPSTPWCFLLLGLGGFLVLFKKCHINYPDATPFVSFLDKVCPATRYTKIRNDLFFRQESDTN